MQKRKQYIEIAPIKETTSDYDAIELALKRFFKEHIYLPLLAELKLPKTILNANENLNTAIQRGTVQFNRGSFTGKFNAKISKELRYLGAIWDRSSRSYKIPLAKLPYDIRQSISLSSAKFEATLKKIDDKLKKILPEEIAEKLKIEHLFEQTLFKVDKAFHKSVEKITVPAQLSDKQRKVIAEDWSQNLKKHIKGFTDEEVLKLRKDIQKSAFEGNRRETMVKKIMDSYGVSERKARFLARQETNLLMAKFKQARYQSAGIHTYKWACVTGTANHPVRPRHKKLAEQSNRGENSSDGKCVKGIYRFDDPPNTAEPNQGARYNNPGEDYNCRCFAVPVINFRGEKK